MAPSIETGLRLICELIDDKPIILNGAGLSIDFVPTTSQLQEQFPQILDKMTLPESSKNRLRDKLREWRNEVGIWLGKAATEFVECLKEIIENCGFDNIQDTSLRAKAQLLDYMDFRSNMAWLGKYEVSIMENRARYRVISRLAKEGCWSSIFTTNWDYWLESGLKQIGVQFNIYNIPEPKTPWKNYFSTFLYHGQEASLQHKIVIYKIHGCAKELNEGFEEYDRNPDKLINAVSRFMLLEHETIDLIGRERANNPRDVSATDKAFMDEFRVKIRGHPFWIIGHSLNDRYIIDQIKEADPQNTSLAVINVEFNSNHEEILPCFNISEDGCFFDLSNEETWNLDNTLLWIQTSYCLERIKQNFQMSANTDVNSLATPINNLLDNLKNDRTLNEDKLLFEFFDSFLPAWMRLVWRSEMVECHGFHSDYIPLDKCNFYVPLNTRYLKRPDLVSGVQILIQLNNQGDSGNLSQFPGGIWKDLILFLPIPLKNGGLGNYLEGLEKHIESFKSKKKFIEEIVIIPLDLDTVNPNYILDDDNIKDNVIRSFRSWGVSFTKEDKIKFISLNDLIL